MLGKIFIYSIAVFGLISVIVFVLSNFYKEKLLKQLGGVFYYLTSASVIAASIFLLANILSHNFQFTYVWEYSSTELHDYFLVASFYSGQQGSFMLWMLIMTVIGLILYWRTQNRDYHSYVMAVYTSIIFFIALILIFKSPFDYVWETFAKEGLELGFTPENGRGLNPILQNYWITIHPPTLFLGYSLMAIPYAFAMTALIKKDYKTWVTDVLPWTLVGAGVLGLGIMLGGFWAYETLGWGGFWAWDPVENSSLIPWLIAVAFIHTLVVQKKTKALVKTNIVLGLLTFIFVIYATFLTRSGVLGDTSVHSFVTPGAIVYNMLVIFQLLYLGVGIILLLFRVKDINQYVGTKGMTATTKEFSMTLGSIVLLALAAVVIIGTSWPAMAEVFGMKKVAIDPENYNNYGGIFAIIFLALNGLSIYQRWISGKIDDVIRKLIIPIGISVITVIFFFFLGLDSPTFLLLSFSAVFALITNVDFIFRKVINSPKKLGAYIAHIGISILILGAVISSVYSTTHTMRLQLDQTKSVYGYNFTFVGFEPIETEFTDREKFKYHIEIERDNKVNMASPIVYWSDYNDKESPFLEPGIYTKINEDFYISPKAIEQVLDIPHISLKKEEMAKNPIDSSFGISIITFVLDRESALVGDKVLLNTVVEYDFDGTKRLDTLQSLLDANSWDAEPSWKPIEGTEYQISMTKLIRDMDEIQNTRAVLCFSEISKPMPEAVDIFTFDITVKPFINLVWFGTILMTVGFFVSIARYSKKKRPNIAN